MPFKGKSKSLLHYFRFRRRRSSSRFIYILFFSSVLGGGALCNGGEIERKKSAGALHDFSPHLAENIRKMIYSAKDLVDSHCLSDLPLKNNVERLAGSGLKLLEGAKGELADLMKDMQNPIAKTQNCGGDYQAISDYASDLAKEVSESTKATYDLARPFEASRKKLIHLKSFKVKNRACEDIANTLLDSLEASSNRSHRSVVTLKRSYRAVTRRLASFEKANQEKNQECAGLSPGQIFPHSKNPSNVSMGPYGQTLKQSGISSSEKRRK